MALTPIAVRVISIGNHSSLGDESCVLGVLATTLERMASSEEPMLAAEFIATLKSESTIAHARCPELTLDTLPDLFIDEEGLGDAVALWHELTSATQFAFEYETAPVLVLS